MRGAPVTQRGFGLLEAIVALTLLATTGAVMFAWLNSSLQTMSRLRDRDDESRLMMNAQALAATIDPLKQATGQMEAAGIRLTWQGELRQGVRARDIAEVDAAQQWHIGLYRLSIKAQSLSRPGLAVGFEMLQVGMQPPVVATN